MTVAKIKKQEAQKSQHDDKINYLGKNEINVDSLKKDHKEFIKNNKLILKTQQRFKSERQNVVTEEINKIALTSNDYKRTSKDLVSGKEQIKCNNIIKRYKND